MRRPGTYDRVRVLGTLVEELLEISRLDAGAEHADMSPCPVGPLVRDVVARSGPATTVVGADETADTDGDADGLAHGVAGAATVRTDSRRLERILTNLVVNAHRHGRAPVVVTVSGDGRTVTVRDHGPGYPGTLLDDGPQRFRTGARERGTGHGLGLTIALGQAQVIGATLEFGDAPDGGALATLRLPAVPPPAGADPAGPAER